MNSVFTDMFEAALLKLFQIRKLLNFIKFQVEMNNCCQKVRKIYENY